jgi:hypothetical protein
VNLSVEVDDSDLARDLARFRAGIDAHAEAVGQAQAATTAAEIRAEVPRRSGRLASTVHSVRVDGGGAVSYGAALPYARYIERRTGIVAAASARGAARYRTACQTAAEQEARKV